MHIYSGSSTTMSQEQLLEALAGLAHRWRADPHLAQQDPDCGRHTELCEALFSRFGIRVTVDDPDNDHTFRVVTRR